MFTTEQASSRWCPFSRALLCESPGEEPRGQTYVGNRDYAHVAGSSEADCLCVAHECMAWRWCDGLGADDDTKEPDMKRLGYCGLAGKP